MRLLSSMSLELREFSQDRIPKYAILSHRWGEEEVLFKDLENKNWNGLKGASKVVKCCERAVADGCYWVWIDTCCIDKSSSAELSEAINSMYSWYAGSAVCYAYLEDLTTSKLLLDMDKTNELAWMPLDESRALLSTKDFEDLTSIVYGRGRVRWDKWTHLITEILRDSTWFSRGWTLQELIAPRRVLFFNSHWEEFGTKRLHANRLWEITRIPIDILEGMSPLFSTIAQRMSWASRRQTTREEDIAYCLMGLFDIHMPPIYGEGREKAFLRLQQEIISRNSDQTLFLWSPEHETYNHGLLATSPAAFCDESECFASLFEPEVSSPYSQLRPILGPTQDLGHRVVQVVDALDAQNSQASLGPSGLHVSLLVQDRTPDDHMRKTTRLVCLDISSTGQNPITHVGFYLAYESEQLDRTGEFIPNRLGVMRRHVDADHGPSYCLIKPGVSFTRKNVSISQVQTSLCGSGKPAEFDYNSRWSPYSSPLLINRVSIIHSGKIQLHSTVSRPFLGTGAIIRVAHHIDRVFVCCQSYVVIGTRQNARPWCSFVSRLPDRDELSFYEETERLSSRLHERSSTCLSCGENAVAIISSDENIESHFIAISINK